LCGFVGKFEDFWPGGCKREIDDEELKVEDGGPEFTVKHSVSGVAGIQEFFC
jgi:hypothetical protein